ncbi:hypothetical protein CFIO01_09069 [Colletotrichum fioriniae PJ7]|uniref:RING-type domain-containing protein n=2 Tax=Colletotrichum fioriniae TaxID=710243 RepID=A0A010Q6C2_9PEZI|nr:hypothetical protein CFIO01_09069 [Colletotrichum fioriniae PJ7]
MSLSAIACSREVCHVKRPRSPTSIPYMLKFWFRITKLNLMPPANLPHFGRLSRSISALFGLSWGQAQPHVRNKHRSGARVSVLQVSTPYLAWPAIVMRSGMKWWRSATPKRFLFLEDWEEGHAFLLTSVKRHKLSSQYMMFPEKVRPGRNAASARVKHSPASRRHTLYSSEFHVPLPLETMNIFKSVMRKQEMASNPAADDTCCAICYEKVGEAKEEGDKEVWRYLPCGHRFGGDCIQHWLGVASVDEPHCPWCRVSMRCDCGHPVVPTTKPTRNYMYWGWMPCEICHTQLQRTRKTSKYFRGQLLPRLNSLIHSLDHNMASIPQEVPKEQEETPTKEPWEDREVWRKKWTEHFIQEDRKASGSKSPKK